MRKYIIGFLVGASLMFALQAGAATLLGSSVDAVIQVEVDGKELGQAPVIDGVSYLPVRKFGNEAGYNVSFSEGEAVLTSETSAQEVLTPETPNTVTTNKSETPTYTLETIESVISSQESTISTYKTKMKVNSSLGTNAEDEARLQQGLKDMEDELARLKSIKAQLEAQQ